MSRYSGQTSYSRYRGRTPKWKIALAVVLVLVILASGGLILLQRHLIYDGNGQARLEMPWGEESPEHDAVEVPELDIQAPVSAQRERRAYRVPAEPLTLAEWETSRTEAAAAKLEIPAVVLRRSGKVFFESQTAVYQSMASAADTMEALAQLTGEERPAIGLVSCFLDPIASQAKLDAMGLKNTGGYIFYDGSNRNWLDPAKPETVRYLSGLLAECAALGFDELVLQEFTFPTEGKLDKIAYSLELTRAEALEKALEAFRTALDEAGYEQVLLSVELTPEAILAGGDDVAGVQLAALAKTADAIYARTTVEQAPALSAAVEAAGEAQFVPILPEIPAPETGLTAFLLAE